MLRALSGLQVDRVWLDIEQGSTYWRGEQFNRDFVSRLISAGGNFPLGVYANWNSWREIMGRGFHQAMSLPLWYPHYQTSGQTFSDFQRFGGWTGPVARQFSESGRSCGIGYDVNWTPDLSVFLGGNRGGGSSQNPTPRPTPRPTPSPTTSPSVTPFAPRCLVATAGLNIRDAPNGRIVGSMVKGTRVQATGIASGWYKIPGGFSSASYLRPCSSPPSSSARMCARVNSNVRSAPSMQGRVLRVVTKHGPVQVLGRSGNWLRVRTASGVVGYSYRNLYVSC